MKKRILATVLLLMVTVSIPWLTALVVDSEVRNLKRFLTEQGYSLSVTDIPGSNAFSADTACEIQLEPGNGSLQVLSYHSPEKRENGMEQWLDYWSTPQTVTLQATLTYLFETENALIWYRPGTAPEIVQQYLESISIHTTSYITTPGTPAAEKEVRKIFQDLQKLGYQVSNIQTAGNDTPEYENITGASNHFSADAVCTAELDSGERKLLFHEYTSSELREQGAKQRQDYFATALITSGTSFYETEYTLVTYVGPEEQKTNDPVRNYLETFMEDTQK